MQQQARLLCAELGERELEGWACLFQGLAAVLSGAGEEGREALLEARELHHRLGVRNGEGRALAALGLIELQASDPARARELVEEALRLQLEADDLWPQGQCHLYLGMIAEDDGSDAALASSHYRQAIDALRPFRDGTLLPAALAFQGGILGRRDPKRALRVLAAASAMRARSGGRFAPVYRERIERAEAAARAALAAEADAIWSKGLRLDADTAIALAFGEATPRPSHPAGLSAREAEVVRLVAEGLPNKVIAAQLHLSVRTVESHVRRALAKVGLENRTQLAGWLRRRVQLRVRNHAEDGDPWRAYCGAMKPYVSGPNEGLAVENPVGGVLTFKSTGAQTDGAITAIDTVAAPGEGPPLHAHNEQDEVIYVLEGSFTVKLAEELTTAEAGSFVFIPRGTPHGWKNAGDAPARLYGALMPAAPAFEEFFMRYAELPVQERGTEAFARLAAETKAFDVLGPPLA